MRARVERGRIRIRFDEQLKEDDLFELQEQLSEIIGSARRVDKVPLELSCALSVQNFKKLRRAACKLDNDIHTLEVVAKLRSDLDAYDLDTQRGNTAKRGGALVEYKFKLPPFEHQKLGFQFLHSMRTPALFGDCGTGKTFIVLTFADSLVKADEKVAFIVICPVNLIHHVWEEDAVKFSDLSSVALREPTVPSVRASDFDEKGDPDGRKELAALRAQRRADPELRKKAARRARMRHRKLLDTRFAQDVDLYIINPESLRTDAKEKRLLDLCKRKRREGFSLCLVIDESSRIKTRTSRIYKALKRVRYHADRCIIMTGTPSPNGILDLWAQFSILDGGKTLHPSFVDYRAEYCKEVVLKYVTWEDKQGNKQNARKWEPRRDAPKRVYRTIEPRMIRFRTEDCIDLPPHRFLVRDVDMSVEQAEVYSSMEDRLFAEFEGEPITAAVAATKLMKLREITGGFVISDEGNDLPIGKVSPKMAELDRMLEQSIATKLGDEGPPSKALIWAQYKWECRTLVERYVKPYGARGLFGGISSSAKDDAIRKFTSDPSRRLLVCHPASVGHGLNLIDANYAFYYSLSYNYEEFYQSFRRMTRPGQLRAMTYYFLVCPGTIDEELLDAIQAKKNLSDIVTDGKFSRDVFVSKRGRSRELQLDLSWPAQE
ncbi:MAG: DEAD/DEAH box helicase family protein [Deltaproteobacteria bacterium]|nr:DEAD/DEAH box helicase family protein [Deltaproteobacteria bacterium]